MEPTISQVQKLTSPNPFALVTSLEQDGTTNLMALSWWSYASNRPATVAIFVSQKGYTQELIRSTGEFGLCIVNANVKEAAFQCGCTSGRKVKKAKEFGIEMVAGSSIRAKLVKESCAALECKVIEELLVQDHVMFLGEVRSIHMDESAPPLFAQNGYADLASV